MPKWNPEEVRLWILKDLYDTRMEHPQATTFYNEEASNRSGFPLKALLNETRYLISKELVEKAGEGAGYISCFIREEGRNWWEEYQRQAQAPQEDEEIGF